MNALEKIQKRRIYTNVIVALVFLFNPNISVIDILPDFVAYFLCGFTSVVFKIFGKGHKSVGVTAVDNLSCLAKAHESVPCSSLSVASGAE